MAIRAICILIDREGRTIGARFDRDGRTIDLSTEQLKKYIISS